MGVQGRLVAISPGTSSREDGAVIRLAASAGSAIIRKLGGEGTSHAELMRTSMHSRLSATGGGAVLAELVKGWSTDDGSWLRELRQVRRLGGCACIDREMVRPPAQQQHQQVQHRICAMRRI